MSKKEKRGIFLIVFAGICWGMIGIYTRFLSQYGFSSVQITFIRNIISAVEMSLLILLTDRKRFVIAVKDIWMFLGTGICSQAFFNICYFKAIEMTTMSVAAILLYTAPFMVLFMSAMFFKEKVTFHKIVAVIIAFLGCIFTTGSFNGTMQFSIIGILLGLGSGFGYALYSIFGSFALKKYHPFTVTFYTFLFAGIFLMPFSQVRQGMEQMQSHFMAPLCGLLLATMSTLLPFLCYTEGLQCMEAGKASVMAFVEPLVATLCGIILFHEQMTISNTIGICLIFIAILLLNIKFNRKIQSRNVG